MPITRRDDLDIHWAERGDGDGLPLVLVHGLLFSSRMFERLAGHFDDRRLLLVDLHGHGKSSKPVDPERYTWDELALDVLAVLDDAGIDRGVVGGTSLGADVTLALGALHPDRLTGLFVEMPVLSDSEQFARSVFGPLSKVLGWTAPVLAPLTAAVGRVPLPRRPPELVMVRDLLSLEPRAAAALLEGLLDAPRPDELALGTLKLPTLVVGHRGDRLHALADAHRVVDLVPGAELHEAPSFLHYRVFPDQLAVVLRAWLERNEI